MRIKGIKKPTVIKLRMRSTRIKFPRISLPLSAAGGRLSAKTNGKTTPMPRNNDTVKVKVNLGLCEWFDLARKARPGHLKEADLFAYL